MFGNDYIVPKWGRIVALGKCGERMKRDVATNFDGATTAVRAGDPKDISFCVFGISEEPSRFTTRVKF